MTALKLCCKKAQVSSVDNLKKIVNGLSRDDYSIIIFPAYHSFTLLHRKPYVVS